MRPERTLSKDLANSVGGPGQFSQLSRQREPDLYWQGTVVGAIGAYLDGF
jgi:hypothetical protein